MKEKESVKGKAWLKREMRPYRPSVILLAGLTVTATLLSLAFSYLIRFVINGAADGDSKRMWIFAAVCAGTALLRVALQVIRSYYAERCRAKITVGLRSRLFTGLLRADYAEAEKYHSGDLLNRFTSDVAEVANTGVSILPAVAGMLVQCVGAIVALFLLNPLFTAVFAASGVFVSLASVFFRKKTKKYHKILTEADGKSRAFMQEGLVSLTTIKAYGAEKRTSEKAENLLGDYYSARMKKSRLNVALGGSFSLLSALSTVFAVVWCSAEIVRKGGSDYGSILSVILLLSQLQQPFTSFSSVLPACYSRAAAAERLAETDDIPAEKTRVRSESEREAEYESAEAICFNEVNFSYAGRETVLRGGKARVPLRKITCITGRSGSGKSTLFKLLMHVYRPQSGGIYLERQNDRKGGEKGNRGDISAAESPTENNAAYVPVTAEQRDLFAYVPQGNFLFSGTIYENLTFFAEKEVSDEELRRAIQTACATFVYDLPEGLSTPLHERGAGLSEGQLQRLAVARALLSRRPILLLDEATSALDENTERDLLANISAMNNVTCLIVTHRSAALSVADAVIGVENGCISLLRERGIDEKI